MAAGGGGNDAATTTTVPVAVNPTTTATAPPRSRPLRRRPRSSPAPRATRKLAGRGHADRGGGPELCSSLERGREGVDPIRRQRRRRRDRVPAGATQGIAGRVASGNLRDRLARRHGSRADVSRGGGMDVARRSSCVRRPLPVRQSVQLRFRPAVAVRSVPARQPDPRHLPARGGREEVAVGRPDVRARREAGPAAQHHLAGHELAVVLAELAFQRTEARDRAGRRSPSTPRRRRTSGRERRPSAAARGPRGERAGLHEVAFDGTARRPPPPTPLPWAAARPAQRA